MTKRAPPLSSFDHETQPCPDCGHDNGIDLRFCHQCGSALGESTPDPLLGSSILGRYTITEIIGEGGMGKVYLGEQQMGKATRKVAIKMLQPELSGDKQIVARFHRESETVIQLS
ncbi:MAG: hypothetical protein KC416_16785, partial [Myxococcales bacterium]|nr:hypothetical protein [Myxococcales bacterium]